MTTHNIARYDLRSVISVFIIIITPQNMYVRNMESYDILRVKEINEKNLSENYPIEFYHLFVTLSRKFCFVAEIDNLVVGYLLSKPDNIDAHVTSLCVDHAHRNMNAGTLLMKACIKAYNLYFNVTATAIQNFRLTLYVRCSNQSAIDFYTKRFNLEIDRRMPGYYNDEDGYYMCVNYEIK